MTSIRCHQSLFRIQMTENPHPWKPSSVLRRPLRVLSFSQAHDPLTSRGHKNVVDRRLYKTYFGLKLQSVGQS